MKYFKRAICICIFICLLAGVLSGATFLFSDKKAIEKYGPFYESDTDFDVIFMGTSHMYNSIFPQRLWDEYGITSYNWGNSNCSIPIDYYLLQYVAKVSKPKVVVIDLFGLIEYEDEGNGKYKEESFYQQHIQFDTMPLSVNKVRAVHDIFDDTEDAPNMLWSFMLYHNRWDELTREDLLPEYTTEKGAELLVGLESLDYTEPEGSKVTIMSRAAGYIPLICDYCSAEGIDVLFTYIPSANRQEQIDIAYTAETWLTQFDCDYLNMNGLGIIDYATDMYVDGSHLNVLGGSKVTDFLGAYLQDYYGLADHRADAAYDSWNADYLAYVDAKASKFEEGRIYENLMLCYGRDFGLTIEMNEESAYIFSYNEKAARMLAQLEGHAQLVTSEEIEDGIMHLTIRNLRADGAVVFETDVTSEEYLQ